MDILFHLGEAFSHEATSQGTQNSTLSDTSSKINKEGWFGCGGINKYKNKKAMH